MVLDIALAPLALEPETFTVGDKLRVTVSFKYTVGVNKTLRLFAGPYYTNILGKHMVIIALARGRNARFRLDYGYADSSVDFKLIPKAIGGSDNGTSVLGCGSRSRAPFAEQDNVIIVTGNPEAPTFSAR